MSKEKGFTLIELIVVLALIAILAVILIAALKPQEIFKKARDAQRQADLRNLSTALDAIFAETIQGTPPLDGATNSRCVGIAASPFIWYSVVVSGTFTATSPIQGSVVTWTRTGSTSNAVNGTGWLPIDFTKYPVIALSQLPLDPINSLSNNLYYTYSCYSGSAGTHYEFNARLESSQAGATDGGDNPSLYERGSTLNILPPATTTGFYQ